MKPKNTKRQEKKLRPGAGPTRDPDLEAALRSPEPETPEPKKGTSDRSVGESVDVRRTDRKPDLEDEA